MRAKVELRLWMQISVKALKMGLKVDWRTESQKIFLNHKKNMKQSFASFFSYFCALVSRITSRLTHHSIAILKIIKNFHGQAPEQAILH